MTSWLRDIRGPWLQDSTHVVMTDATYSEVDAYHESVPTAPSAGRVYRRTTPAPGRPHAQGVPVRHWLYIVDDDPAQPGWQLHKPYEVLLV